MIPPCGCGAPKRGLLYRCHVDVIPNLDPRSRYGGFAVDVGAGHSAVPKASSAQATPGPTHTPLPTQPTGGVWVEGGARPEQAGPSHGSFAAIPIYIWMATLGLCAAIFVSGPPFVIRDGLHLHPIYGVAAGFALIGLYRYLMTWWPTALLVTLASTSAWAILLWAWRHAAQLRDLPTGRREAVQALTTLVARFQHDMLTKPDAWVVSTVAAAVLVHVLYWRHRRAVATEQGWLFNRGITHAARILGTLAATSAVLGWGISFLANWSR